MSLEVPNPPVFRQTARSEKKKNTIFRHGEVVILKEQHSLYRILSSWGACDGAFGWVTALQAGRSRVRFPVASLESFIDISFRPRHGPGIDSTSNGKEHREYFLRDKSGCYVGLTALPPSCANCLEIWELQPPETLIAFTGIEEEEMFFHFCYIKTIHCFVKNVYCYPSTSWIPRRFLRSAQASHEQHEHFLGPVPLFCRFPYRRHVNHARPERSAKFRLGQEERSETTCNAEFLLYNRFVGWNF